MAKDQCPRAEAEEHCGLDGWMATRGRTPHYFLFLSLPSALSMDSRLCAAMTNGQGPRAEAEEHCGLDGWMATRGHTSRYFFTLSQPSALTMDSRVVRGPKVVGRTADFPRYWRARITDWTSFFLAARAEDVRVLMLAA